MPAKQILVSVWNALRGYRRKRPGDVKDEENVQEMFAITILFFFVYFVKLNMLGTSSQMTRKLL